MTHRCKSEFKMRNYDHKIMHLFQFICIFIVFKDSRCKISRSITTELFKRTKLTLIKKIEIMTIIIRRNFGLEATGIL